MFREVLSMNDLCNALNQILDDWKTQYDVNSNVELQFAMKEAGVLWLNKLPIPLDNELFLETANFNIDTISFGFEGGQTIEITMTWPEDSSPCLSTLSSTSPDGTVRTLYIKN